MQSVGPMSLAKGGCTTVSAKKNRKKETWGVMGGFVRNQWPHLLLAALLALCKPQPTKSNTRCPFFPSARIGQQPNWCPTGLLLHALQFH